MKEQIAELIRSFTAAYQQRPSIATRYGDPMIGFADARHPYIQNLPQIISPTHALPQDILPDAKIIIAYYLPFTRELAKTNRLAGILASPEWARAYEETNALFDELNQELIRFIRTKAGRAGVLPEAATFDRNRLLSDWSHRHIAYAAGLGTFGLNNMLLTRQGCCGRFRTLVTNLDFPADQPLQEEYCLYKKNGTCGKCADNCPTGALTRDSYDRRECYILCQENARIYTSFGSSYTTEDGSGPYSIGSEVCGKCITNSPCAFWKLR